MIRTILFARKVTVMIKHVYLYRLRPEIDSNEVKKRLLTLREMVPQIADMEVGLNFKPAENAYDLIEFCTFKSREDFVAFGANEYHEQIRQYMKNVQLDGVKIDYEME